MTEKIKPGLVRVKGGIGGEMSTTDVRSKSHSAAVLNETLRC